MKEALRKMYETWTAYRHALDELCEVHVAYEATKKHAKRLKAAWHDGRGSETALDKAVEHKWSLHRRREAAVQALLLAAQPAHAAHKACELLEADESMVLEIFAENWEADRFQRLDIVDKRLRLYEGERCYTVEQHVERGERTDPHDNPQPQNPKQPATGAETTVQLNNGKILDPQDA